MCCIINISCRKNAIYSMSRKKKIPTNMSCVSVLILILSVSFFGKNVVMLQTEDTTKQTLYKFQFKRIHVTMTILPCKWKKKYWTNTKNCQLYRSFSTDLSIDIKVLVKQTKSLFKILFTLKRKFKNIEHFWLKSWRWLFYYTEWVKIGPVWLKSTRPSE